MSNTGIYALMRELGVESEEKAYQLYGMYVEGYLVTNDEPVKLTLYEWLEMEVEQEHQYGEGRPRPPASHDDEVLYRVTRAQAEIVAGRWLTGDEADEVRKALEHSSIPEAVCEVVDAVITEGR